MRRLAIRNTLDRAKTMLKDAGGAEPTPDSIAEQAKLRIEKTKKHKEG